MKKTNKNNKGFTLVELIVVLVILAILAAILVPALLGYIDRARGAQVLLNAKSVLTSAQAECSNCYGTAKSGDTIATMLAADSNAKLGVIATTADMPAGSTATFTMKAAAAEATPTNHDAWTVDKVVYTENGVTCYYDGKTWEQNSTTKSLSGGYNVAGPALPTK